MPKFVELILIAIFRAIIEKASPIIRETIGNFLDDLAEKAAATPNYFDDAAVDFLKAVLKYD